MSGLLPRRLGVTIPGPGPLLEQRGAIERLPGWGYTEVWTADVDAHDAFVPLALASTWAPELRLGTAIVPVSTRGRAVLAQSVGTLAQAAPGRVAIGIGGSSAAVVRRWNGAPYEFTPSPARGARRPLGEPVGAAGCTHRSARRPRQQPPRARRHWTRRADNSSPT